MHGSSDSFVRKRCFFGLPLVTAAWMFAALATGAAQDPALPATNPVVKLRIDQPKRIDVTTSSPSIEPLAPDMVVEGVNVIDRTVCNVVQIRGGVILEGLKLGKTRVTLWGERLGIKNFDVFVSPDRTDVMSRLLAKYPQSGLSLTPSPETGKVLVEGTLPSAWAIQDVLEQLEGPGLSRSQMLNRMCYSIPSCPVPCESTCYPARWGRR